MDILKLLKQDHDVLKSILNQLEMTTDRAARARKKLLDTLISEFELHARAEELIYYRRLMSDDDAHELAYEGYEEHKVARIALQDVVRTPPNEESWKPRLKVFKELVNHHIEEEEGEFFEHSRECFSDDLDRLGDRFLAKKAELKQRAKEKLRAAA